MAFGITWPEARNAEINRRFTGVVQMHASALRLKLRVFHLFNVNAFCSAMYNKAIAQVRKPLVPGRRKSKWEFFAKWNDWRTARNNADVINKLGESVWCGDGCNLMYDMARETRAISEWKAGRGPGGRGFVRGIGSRLYSGEKKGRVEIAHPED